MKWFVKKGSCTSSRWLVLLSSHANEQTNNGAPLSWIISQDHKNQPQCSWIPYLLTLFKALYFHTKMTLLALFSLAGSEQLLTLLVSVIPSGAVPSLLAYSLQNALRTPALFFVSLGTNIFSTPTQAHFAPTHLSHSLSLLSYSRGLFNFVFWPELGCLVKELRPSAVAMVHV